MKVPLEELWEAMGIKKGGFQAMKQRKSNPNYDSLHGLLEKYEQINPDWVLFEKGTELPAMPLDTGNRIVYCSTMRK